MKVIPKLLVFFLFLTVIFIFAPPASAIVFPECRWDEITTSCNCPHANNVCADNTCSACLEYKNDPQYRFLWKDIYCRKGSVLELAAKFEYSFIIPFLTMVVLGSAVFLVRGYRKTREVLSVVLANSLAFFFGVYLIQANSLLYTVLRLLGILALFQNPAIRFTLYGMDLPRLVALLSAAIVMAISEALFLLYIAKFGDRKKVFATAAIALAVAFLGLGILNAVYPHFLHPRLF